MSRALGGTLKVATAFVVLVITVGGLTGCGSSSKPSPSPSPSPGPTPGPSPSPTPGPSPPSPAPTPTPEPEPVARRYGRSDMKLYTYNSFIAFYGNNTKAETEWEAAPEEQRVARDSTAYILAEFKQYYATDWLNYWQEAPEAIQYRQTNDKIIYNMTEFFNFYSKSWPEKWAQATAEPCAQCCKGLPRPTICTSPPSVVCCTSLPWSEFCQWTAPNASVTATCNPKASAVSIELVI